METVEDLIQLVDFLKRQGKKQGDIAKDLVIGETYFSKILSGKRNFSGKLKEKIKNKFKIDIEKMLNEKKHPKNYEKRNRYNTLASDAMPLIQTNNKIETKNGNRLIQLEDGRYKMDIKMVEEYAYGGYLTGFNDHSFLESLPAQTIIVDEVKRGFYRAFRVIGESMEYDGKWSIDEGDIVIGRNVDRPFWKSKLHLKKWRAWIIVTKERIMIKQIIKHDVENGIITCRSNNPDKKKYPDFDISLNDVSQLFNVTKVEKEW